eukprot:TRINITY_DN81768_c0_g1_i1.p1 TRINITY_DN81768_c0_g1~~TRINITY_DN81768_c0_g1_i1.p1  ORF type:complete len:557 (-),score=102.32 TRINITY_DN81768_c0_g1_i1:306-1976(-)
MERMVDPLTIRFSQDNIGQDFRDGTSIFETYEHICDGMEKRNVAMMHVVFRDHYDGQYVTLDNRRLAVYKMARHAGKCGTVKVLIVPNNEVKSELRRKSDSKVEGLSVRVRGTDKIVHADGSITVGPRLPDGQLQHRADQGGHWTEAQLQCIDQAIIDFQGIIKRVLGSGSTLVKAGSFMKGTDIAGESDVDVMVFGCGPISESQWQGIVNGIKCHPGGYTVKSTNPRCIHVEAVRSGAITIEFDVVAKQRQGFPPNAVPTNPFKNNRIAAHAVRNIKMDFMESGEKRFSGHEIETAVLAEQKNLESVGLGKLIDITKAALQTEMRQRLKRPRTAARENDAKQGNVDWKEAVGEGKFRKVYQGQYTVGERVGQANVNKVFKDGTQAFESSFFDQDLAVVEKAIDIANAFNAAKKFSHFVQVCKPAVWQMMDTKQKILVEPFVKGFESFNSNTAWVGSSAWAQALQSISHFSYHHTDGQMVLCDLQGAIENDTVILTDPVLNSQDKRYGPTDLGAKGIENFFHHHVCTKWCDSGWQKPLRTFKHFTPMQGTSMALFA